MSENPSHALDLERNAYYRFLRRVYGMKALEAWDYVTSHGLPPTADEVRAILGWAEAGPDGPEGPVDP